MATKSSNQKVQEMLSAETNFNLKLGDKIYTLNFGTSAFMRLKSENPSISNPMTFLDEVSMIEAIPLLIQAAIKPELREWTNVDDLFDMYDACEDPAISKVIPAFISAAGTAAKKLNPAIEAVNKLVDANNGK